MAQYFLGPSDASIKTVRHTLLRQGERVEKFRSPLRQYLQASSGQSGFTLVEILIAVGLSSLLVLGLSSVLVDFFFFQDKLRSKLTVTDLRIQITEILLDESAVRNTVYNSENPSFRCVLDNKECPSTATPVRVFDRHGNELKILAPPSGVEVESDHGVTQTGVPCQAFDAAAGNPACPFQVSVHWLSVCGAGCAEPQIQWQIRIRYHPGEVGQAMRLTQAQMEIYSNIGGLSPLKGMDVGLDDSCVWYESGEVKCWGHNWTGNLGNGSSGSVNPVPQTVIDIDGRPLRNVIKVVNGNNTNCALTREKTLLCWGENHYGQLGRGIIAPPVAPWTEPWIDYDPAPPGTIWNASTADFVRSPVDPSRAFDQIDEVYGGENATCVRRLGDIWCWGLYGQWWGPTDAPHPDPNVWLHDTAGVMKGFALPAQVQATATATLPTPWEQFYTGVHAHCFLLQPKGDLSCWELNSLNSLGAGGADQDAKMNAVRRIPTIGHQRPINVDATVAPENGLNLEGVKDLAIGGSFMCAVMVDGHVVCWGSKRLWNNLLTVSNKTGFENDASSSFERPGYVLAPGGAPGSRLTDIVGVNVSWNHACATSREGKVYCWGHNSRGQTGDGLTIGSFTPAPVLVALPGRAQRAFAGLKHSCALLTTGDVYCWGDNVRAQLGQGPGSANNPGLSAVPLKVLGL